MGLGSVHSPAAWIAGKLSLVSHIVAHSHSQYNDIVQIITCNKDLFEIVLLRTLAPGIYWCFAFILHALPGESPYRQSDLSEGNHHFRINVSGRSCESSRPFTFRFDIEDDEEAE